MVRRYGGPKLLVAARKKYRASEGCSTASAGGSGKGSKPPKQKKDKSSSRGSSGSSSSKRDASKKGHGSRSGDVGGKSDHGAAATDPLLATMVEMGFEEALARAALQATGGTVSKL